MLFDGLLPKGKDTAGDPKAIETNHSRKKRIAEKFDEYLLTHVLTHTGISASGQSITEWIYDLRVLRKSGLKRAKKHRIARVFGSDRSS